MTHVRIPTLVPGAPSPVEQQHTELHETLPPLDPAAARWLAVAEHVAVRFPGVARKVATGAATVPGGRWVLVAVVAVGGGLLGGIGVTAWHSSTDSQELLTRIERLEAAMVSADEHNAWVQAALVALGENKPPPPPPYRRMAPP